MVLKGEKAENGKSQILDLARGLLPPSAISTIPAAKLGDEIKKARKGSLEQRVEDLTKFLYDSRKGSKAALVGPGQAIAGQFGGRVKRNGAGAKPH